MWSILNYIFMLYYIIYVYYYLLFMYILIQYENNYRQLHYTYY